MENEKDYSPNAKALRFISAYNIIDNTLRSLYDFKRSMNFADMIHRSANLNHTVRKYEDTIIDYGRLRNSIVHSSSDEIIAIPNDSVVDEFEKIARLISTPPKALQTIASREVICVDAEELVKDVIQKMSKYGYKSIPVYKDGLLVGIANAARVLETIGGVMNRGEDIDDYIASHNIGQLIEKHVMENYYAVIHADASIEEVLELFWKNRKMLAVLLTQTGNYMEKPKGIITIADIMDMNKILDMY